jgi:hypothetical protein
VEDADLRLRNLVYGRFVELRRVASVEELARDSGEPAAAVEAGLRRLHEAHALVLERGEPPRIRMLNPFSAVPTAFRVLARGAWWYANCAWDAFGVPAALGVDGRVSTSCPDCAEPLELAVRSGAPVGDGHLVHLLVPAERWWDDIVYT